MSTCGVDSCDRRHCVVCGRRHLEPHEPQTCVYCLGRVRSDLARIVDAYALLPAELVDGGRGQRYDLEGPRGVSDGLPDALVMLAGGNVSGRHDPTLELESDPVPPLVLLASWEDDWRHVRGFPAGGPATITGVSSFLADNLGWAAQHHPAFDEFASDLRRLRARVEAATRLAEPSDRGVGCPECGEPLTRRYRQPQACRHGPRPRLVRWYGLGYDVDIWQAQLRAWEAEHAGCDQGGAEADWTCDNRECSRIRVSAAEYWVAVAAAYARLGCA